LQSGADRFQVDDDLGSGVSSKLRNELVVEDLDRLLCESGHVPDLGRAPIASWMLARLARLTSGKVGFSLTARQNNDGGGYAIDFVTHTDERPIAEFQLQADMAGAAILGRRILESSSDEIIQAFLTALLAAPCEVDPCNIAVRDPEWKEDPENYAPKPKRTSRNRYGWDAGKYLGADNIREAS
jgi:hypothetical protein